MKRVMLFMFLLCFILHLQAEEVKVFVLTHPVSNQRVLSNEPVLVPTSSEILIIATPGEYEPGSFVLTGKGNLGKVEIEVSDLKSKEREIINSSSIDIKIVKCWYQDKGRGYIEKTPAREYNPVVCSGEKVLVPELLLNDDNLIKVDYEKGKNYLKIKTEKEEKYIDITPGNDVEEIEKELPSGYNKWSGMTLVKDSEKLLPFELKENENKQVWLTIKVPEDQKEGIYEGIVKIKNEGKELVSIPIKVRVLPFKLGKSHEISSIYYYFPSKGIYGENVKEQFRKEMANLFQHGIINANYHGKPTKEYLQIRQDIGIENQPLFLQDYQPYPYKELPIEFTPEDIEKTKKNVQEVLEIVKEFGIKDVYFYGWDEASGKRLAAQRPVWEAIHEAGGKVFVAGYKGDNFALMGDIQDLFVRAGYPSREEVEKWHAKGHKIVCYANPQGGVEAPDTYRRNFGILLWQYNYDGDMTYIYHWGCRGFGEMWSDWCEKGRYKAHNMVYPVGNGVIDTLQWEGYREGIDDVRYLNVLVEEVKKAKDSQMVKKEAEKFLSELKVGDINKDIEDMDSLRLKIINYIMKLKEGK